MLRLEEKVLVPEERAQGQGLTGCVNQEESTGRTRGADRIEHIERSLKRTGGCIDRQAARSTAGPGQSSRREG